MPELPEPKVRPHPNLIASDGDRAALRSLAIEPYAELQVTSNFTFLTGASHPDELVQQAAMLGYRAIAITDRNSLAGIVRAHVAAKEIGIPLAIGCRLEIYPDLSILVYPTSRAAYGRLCRLLTLGKRRAEKGQCHLTIHDVMEHHQGLLAVVIPPETLDQQFIETLHGLRRCFDDDRISLAVSRLYNAYDQTRLNQLHALSLHTNVPLAVTNDVHYHVPQRRALQDVITCIRHGCTIDEAGLRLFANAERHLKSPREIACAFASYSWGKQAIERSVDVALRAAQGFSLDELRYEYPDEVVPSGKTPMQHLIDLTWAGAAKHYPKGVPGKVRAQIEHEFQLIDDLNYAPYFLTVHDLVVYARSRNILCQGRGAAANSAVCYCLGVTAVDPDRIDLLFERFVSKERNEPPDIDIDFEHERREEVIQYIYQKYGRDRAALTAVVVTYRGRSAVREVGKALGLSLDCVDRLAKNIDWWSSGVAGEERLRELGVNPDDPTMKRLVALADELLGFPRHLSQHVGGFVMTRGLLCESVPIENAAMEDRTVIEWDKDDIEAIGMLKVDVLGLGMLTCIRKAFELVDASNPGAACGLALHTIPPEDPAVYDMICAADTIGVFQIESRAQMSMLPRLRPRSFYDLVIEVAIVRPGPIQGDMVHPYLRRRNGEETVTYHDDKVRRVLEKTLGVPLFQEQAMSLAIVAAGFTAGEADQLRRAIAAWKTRGNKIEQFGLRIVKGMTERGYPREFAQRCFEQIKGFSGYGFPESHAASFALLVYVSAWLKKHHPAEFAAALINSQPMGFYMPAQLVRDAREHGVEVQPIDVNFSTWDCAIERETHEGNNHRVGEVASGSALRLGMRLIKGLSQVDADAIAAAVTLHGPFNSIDDLHRASGVRVSVLRRLAYADAFGSMGLDRQAAMWHVRALRDEKLPMFDEQHTHAEERSRLEIAERRVSLPSVRPLRKVAHDYASIGLSLRPHPMSFIRERLNAMRATPTGELKDQARWKQGMQIAVAGIVLVRQRPSTANGIVFMTIEDETGVANLIIRPEIYKKYRKAARHAVVLLARGRVERQGDVVHVLARTLDEVDLDEQQIKSHSRDFH
jgi:error-prone DNA polymerase